MTHLTLTDLPPWIVRIVAILFGLLWGSFLNVVIYRLPRNMSVVHPPSHCPSCKAPVKPWHNIPILSYVILRGKSHCCKTPMSPRYPLVEAMGGVLSLAIVEAILLHTLEPLPLSHALLIYLSDFALCMGLVAAAFIDLEHMYLPDSITLGGAALGFLTCSFRGLSWLESGVGALVGFVIVWLPFVVAYPLIRKNGAGMGLGDAKLVMLAGAWFGWSKSLLVLGLGAVQGTIVTLLVLLFKGKIDEPEAVKRERHEIQEQLAQMTPEEREVAEKELELDPLMQEAGEGVGQARIAFGPFLILAILEQLLFGEHLWKLMFE